MEPNTEAEILQTLKRLSEFFEKQKKMQKVSLVMLAIILPVFIGAPMYKVYRRNQASEQASKAAAASEEWDWYRINTEQEIGHHEVAIKKGTELLSKTPESPFANRRLGSIYLNAGDAEKALSFYQKAFELLPCETNEERLLAVKKRLGVEIEKEPQEANLETQTDDTTEN